MTIAAPARPAAGAGRRYGGPKQLAELRGRALLEHVLDSARSWDPLVVIGAWSSRLDPYVAHVEHVICPGWEEGQAASLRAGVAALGSQVEAAVVLLADQPFITPGVIAEAVGRYESGWDAVRTLYGGTPGHPVVLGARVLAAVPSLRGDVGARELLGTFRVRSWEAGQLCDPVDIDTPEDLASVR